MRIKYFFFSLFLIGFVGVCRSQPVSQTKATEIAFRFFNKEVRGIISSSTWHSLSGIVNQTQTTVWKESNRACMYVVNMPDSGWVLVAGDEKVCPGRPEHCVPCQTESESQRPAVAFHHRAGWHSVLPRFPRYTY